MIEVILGRKIYKKKMKKMKKMKKNEIISDIEKKSLEHFGLGFFYVLGERIMINIFKLLDHSDLLKLSLVSKTLYVYANDEELWKVLNFFLFWIKKK